MSNKYIEYRKNNQTWGVLPLDYNNNCEVEWIDANEKKPPNDENVWVYVASHGFVDVDCYRDYEDGEEQHVFGEDGSTVTIVANGWYDLSEEVITHWAYIKPVPTPNPPKGDKE